MVNPERVIFTTFLSFLYVPKRSVYNDKPHSVAALVGSLRKDSINRKASYALIDLRQGL
jgi:hypothetical protein